MPKKRTLIYEDDKVYCLFLLGMSILLTMIGSSMAFHG